MNGLSTRDLGGPWPIRPGAAGGGRAVLRTAVVGTVVLGAVVTGGLGGRPTDGGGAGYRRANGRPTPLRSAVRAVADTLFHGRAAGRRNDPPARVRGSDDNRRAARETHDGWRATRETHDGPSPVRETHDGPRPVRETDVGPRPARQTWDGSGADDAPVVIRRVGRPAAASGRSAPRAGAVPPRPVERSGYDPADEPPTDDLSGRDFRRFAPRGADPAAVRPDPDPGRTRPGRQPSDSADGDSADGDIADGDIADGDSAEGRSAEGRSADEDRTDGDRAREDRTSEYGTGDGADGNSDDSLARDNVSPDDGTPAADGSAAHPGPSAADTADRRPDNRDTGGRVRPGEPRQPPDEDPDAAWTSWYARVRDLRTEWRDDGPDAG